MVCFPIYFEKLFGQEYFVDKDGLTVWIGQFKVDENRSNDVNCTSLGSVFESGIID